MFLCKLYNLNFFFIENLPKFSYKENDTWAVDVEREPVGNHRFQPLAPESTRTKLKLIKFIEFSKEGEISHIFVIH